MKKRITNVLIFVLILWAIKILDSIVPFDFLKLGLLPRSVTGLMGIIFAPLLHANYFHIMSNTLPITILLIALFTFYKEEAFMVIFGSVLIGGGLVWLFARANYHVGISGLIYSLAAFLIMAGFYKKDVKSLLISVVIVILYGGLIWGIFPGRFWVSWEGHLFGAVAGVAMAYRLFKADKKEA